MMELEGVVFQITSMLLLPSVVSWECWGVVLPD